MAAKSHNAARRKKRKQARRAALAAAAQQAAQAGHAAGVHHHLEGAADGGDSDDWETDGAVLSCFLTRCSAEHHTLHFMRSTCLMPGSVWPNPGLAQCQTSTCWSSAGEHASADEATEVHEAAASSHEGQLAYSSPCMALPCAKVKRVPALCARMLWLGLNMAQKAAQGRKRRMSLMRKLLADDARAEKYSMCIKTQDQIGSIPALNAFLPPILQARVLTVESTYLKRKRMTKMKGKRKRERKRGMLMEKRRPLRRMAVQRSPACAS